MTRTFFQYCTPFSMSLMMSYTRDTPSSKLVSPGCSALHSTQWCYGEWRTRHPYAASGDVRCFHVGVDRRVGLVKLDVHLAQLQCRYNHGLIAVRRAELALCVTVQPELVVAFA